MLIVLTAFLTLPSKNTYAQTNNEGGYYFEMTHTEVYELIIVITPEAIEALKNKSVSSWPMSGKLSLNRLSRRILSG